jgi:tRNA1(Val) A37 N6-methylase TrmN6
MAETDFQATPDALMGGAVRLVQSTRGYRAGMDAALLAAACDAGPGETGLEAGCGAGAVLLMAAVRAPRARFVGVERDPDALALAAENVALNGLAERVTVEVGDVARLAARGVYDLALANPPFFDDAAALRGPAPERRGAWIADDGLQSWTETLTKAVREGGRVILIHRADRLADLLALLGRRAGSFQIRPVQSFADAPASRVIVRAVRAGRAPLKLLPALVLHPRDGAKHTPEAEAILRGAAGLGWI